jgi:perosamine synthetase
VTSRPPADRIPLAVPDLAGNEEKYVLEAIRSSWISSTGPFVDRFEREFATACGTRTAVSVSNGTTALHLALLALDARAGDEVLLPSLTYVATANAVRYAGAEPVFVDVDPDTWCIDPTLLEAAVTSRTKGIIAVHLYGHPADMDAIGTVAAKHALWVIEDAAEAHFAEYKGRRAGALGRIGMFSFYGNKIVTCGEGGALTLDDPALERRARLLRGQGVDPSRRYYFPVVGYNYRLTNVACAMLCAQLERHEAMMTCRRDIFRRYREACGDIPGIGFQPVAPWARMAPWLFSVTVGPEYGRSRDDLMGMLGAEGIETRPFFFPLHRLPAYREASERRGGHLPTTDDLADRGMNLPTFIGLSDEQIDRIGRAIRRLRR